MNNHIMLDCETIGTVPGSTILTIGGFRFDPRETDLIGTKLEDHSPRRQFYARIDRRSCFLAGMEDEQATLDWWEKQSAEARQEAFDAGPRVDIDAGLVDLRDFCNAYEEPHPWSHGAGFDVALLEWAMRLFGIAIPWNFRHIRDTRTAYSMAGQYPRNNGLKHHALHDAFAQAEAVQRAFNAIIPTRCERLEEALKTIADVTNPDDPESHRSDDREGCLDTVHSIALDAISTADGERG